MICMYSSYLIPYLLITITGTVIAQEAGGKNVCPWTQKVTLYQNKRHTQTYNQAYRSCCLTRKRRCLRYCMKYRQAMRVYYVTKPYTRTFKRYRCCKGWRVNPRRIDCTIPDCQPSCQHGTCIGTNICKCYQGYQGPHCKQDINECLEMNLPDYKVVVKPPYTTHPENQITTSSKPTRNETEISSEIYRVLVQKSNSKSSAATPILKSFQDIPPGSDIYIPSTSIQPKPSRILFLPVLTRQQPLTLLLSSKPTISLDFSTKLPTPTLMKTLTLSTLLGVFPFHSSHGMSFWPTKTLEVSETSFYSTRKRSIGMNTGATVINSKVIAKRTKRGFKVKEKLNGFADLEKGAENFSNLTRQSQQKYSEEALDVVEKTTKHDILNSSANISSDGKNCSQVCTNTIGSFLCECYKGFYLKKNGRTCLDVDECAIKQAGCSHRCINTIGSYTCDCPDPLLYLSGDGKTCKAHGMNLLCTNNYMEISFEKQLLLGLDVEYLRLTDPSCTGWANKTHLIFRTELDKCGTTVYEDKGTETYKNVVTNKNITVGNLITRVRELMVPFQCIYKRSATVTGVSFKPDSHKLTFSEEGYGKFTFVIAMYKGPQYIKSYSHDDYPVGVNLGQRLYFEVKVTSKDSHLHIFLDKCYASSYSQKEKGPEYLFIQNGCSKDPTLQYYYNLGSFQRFSIKAFKFLTNFSNIYIHCNVVACRSSKQTTRCNQGCQLNRKHFKRGPEKRETNLYAIVAGPLYSTSHISKNRGKHLNSAHQN